MWKANIFWEHWSTPPRPPQEKEGEKKEKGSGFL